MPAEPQYFATPEALRRWFNVHGASATELVVGYMKVGSGRPSVTWPQSVDEALCVGWIDGVRHRIDEERYKIRFTPRRPSSHWSDVNIRRVAGLLAEGRMKPAGLAAFALRTEARSRRASFEQPHMPQLGPDDIKQMKKTPRAWAFYESVPATYKRQVTWWVISAKQAATRERRLAKLIDACAQGLRL